MMRWEGLTGIAEETDFGIAVEATKVLAVNRGVANVDVTRPDDQRATGLRWRFRSIVTGLDTSYEMELECEAENIGHFLNWGLGSVSSATLDGDETRHTFTPAASLDSFTFTVDRGVGDSPAKLYSGNKVGTLRLENAAREILMMTVSGIGKQEADGSALSATLTEFDENPFTFDQLGVSIGLNGAEQSSDTAIERIMFEINNNLVENKYTADGTKYRNAIPEGRLMVTGEYDKEFESISEYNAYVANQQLDITATWTGASMGTNNYRLLVDIPEAKITSVPLPDIEGTDDRGIYTVSFETLYGITDEYVVSILLDNEVASY